jgi:hypothetical protein
LGAVRIAVIQPGKGLEKRRHWYPSTVDACEPPNPLVTAPMADELPFQPTQEFF